MKTQVSPEVVIVGARIGGRALAIVLARAGIAVTMLEKSLAHLDHVRGEWIAPWGVAETQRLGLDETLIAAGGHHLAHHISYGDDVDAQAAESQLLDLTALESAGFKPPLNNPSCILLASLRREVT
jgi:menaquinone-9 beta-reductase